MDRGRSSIFAAVIGVVGAVALDGPRLLVDHGIPGWLPVYGTIGETATLYLYAADIVGGVVLVGLAVGGGWWLGRRIDLREEFTTFTQAVTAGVTLPILVGWLVGVAMFVVGSSSAFSLLVVTGLALRLFATVSLPVVIGMVAGAAVDHFWTGGRPRIESNGTDDAAPLSD